jgi:hypothetical protein
MELPMRYLIALMFACFSLVPTGASAQGLIPGDAPLFRAACVQWLDEHSDFHPTFHNLPPICYWHYAGWDCEQPWTPAGWLRPGGYCEQARSTKSLVTNDDSDFVPRRDCPVRRGSTTMMQPPTEVCEYPTNPG